MSACSFTGWKMKSSEDHINERRPRENGNRVMIVGQEIFYEIVH